MTSAPPPASTEPTEPVADAKAAARAARIAAAVERSKTEYQPQHAYTERGWFLESEQAGPSKKDRQRVEYAATARLLSHPEPTLVVATGDGPTEERANDAYIVLRRARAARALDDVLSCLPLNKGVDPNAEDLEAEDIRDLTKLSGMPRELLGTALRAAQEAGKPTLAAEIARSLKRHWKANPGLAHQSSDALVSLSPAESLRPLFVITAVAVHYPILLAMASRLQLASANARDAGDVHGAAALNIVAKVAETLASNRAWAFQGDLFSEERRPRPPPAVGGELREPLENVDRRALEKIIGVDGSTLEAALRRLRNALGRSEDDVVIPEGERNERGVRDL